MSITIIVLLAILFGLVFGVIGLVLLIPLGLGVATGRGL
jgi:hypothetical protein